MITQMLANFLKKEKTFKPLKIRPACFKVCPSHPSTEETCRTNAYTGLKVLIGEA